MGVRIDGDLEFKDWYCEKYNEKEELLIDEIHQLKNKHR